MLIGIIKGAANIGSIIWIFGTTATSLMYYERLCSIAEMMYPEDKENQKKLVKIFQRMDVCNLIKKIHKN